MLPTPPMLLLALAVCAGAAEPRDISPALEPVRAKYHLPACASAVMKEVRITAR